MKASFFTESILYWLVRGLSGFSQRVSPTCAAACGSGLGWCAYHLLGRRKVIAFGNLRAAFGSSYTPAEYERILRELFQNLGMTLMEVARIPRIDRAYIDRWITLTPKSLERVESALSRGHGAIFLNAHFGNWELASIAGALHGYPTLVLAREQGWPRLNNLLNRYRESKGCRVVSKGFMIRQLIRGLEARGIVGILADQDGGRNGVLAPFFGRLASTAPGTIALSLDTQAPIVPVFVVRRRGPAHTLVVEEPLSIPSSGSLEERIQGGIAAYLKVLEQYVRRYPSQWLWLHRRWKSSPERRLLILSDGKPGHLTQARSFSQRIEAAWLTRAKHDKRLRLGAAGRPLVRVETVQVRYRNPLARGLVTFVASVAPRRFPGGDFWLRLGLTPASYQALQSHSADIGLSCGATAAPVNLLWSWGAGARAIHMTRSRWPSWRRFHLSVIPKHDRPPLVTPANLLVMDGALAPLNGERDETQLQEWHEALGLRKSRQIGVMIGGPARGVEVDSRQVSQMIAGLLDSCEALDAELLVTSSRRTPLPVEEQLYEILGKHPRCRLLVLANRKEAGALKKTSDAVACILGLAELIVVSGDSISMVSEAAARQKPVISFFPKRTGFQWGDPKYHRFLRQMDAEGKVTIVDPERVGDAVEKALQQEGVRHRVNFLKEGSVSDTEVDPIVEYLVKWL